MFAFSSRQESPELEISPEFSKLYDNTSYDLQIESLKNGEKQRKLNKNGRSIML